jgi:hypothetical protein
LRNEVGIDLDHFLRRQDFAFALQLITASFLVEKFRRCRIEGDIDVFAGLVAGLFDRLDDERQRFVGALEIGRKAAFVADVGVVTGLPSSRPFRVWKISAP